MCGLGQSVRVRSWMERNRQIWTALHIAMPSPNPVMAVVIGPAPAMMRQANTNPRIPAET